MLVFAGFDPGVSARTLPVRDLEASAADASDRIRILGQAAQDAERPFVAERYLLFPCFGPTAKGKGKKKADDVKDIQGNAPRMALAVFLHSYIPFSWNVLNHTLAERGFDNLPWNSYHVKHQSMQITALVKKYEFLS
jgi:hypothetical protein